MNSTFQQSDVETALRNQGITDFKVATTGTEGTTLNIRIPKLDSDEEIQTLQAGLEAELLAKYPAMDTVNATASYVGPTAGATLVKNAILSVLIASALMLMYIAFRFNFFSGMAAVIGLLHDVLIMHQLHGHPAQRHPDELVVHRRDADDRGLLHQQHDRDLRPHP